MGMVYDLDGTGTTYDVIEPYTTGTVHKPNKVMHPDATGSVYKPLNTLHFKAGMLKEDVSFWKSITSDCAVLQMITGCDIEFDDGPVQTKAPLPYKLPLEKKYEIALEIRTLLKKEVIKVVAESQAVLCQTYLPGKNLMTLIRHAASYF